jgi:uncharacterized protein YjbI with pentapeptide repeats
MFEGILNGRRSAPKPNNGAEAPKSSAFAELIRKPDFNRETDLIGKDFRGQDFGEIDIEGFDFSGADLRGANLSQVQNIVFTIGAWNNTNFDKETLFPSGVTESDLQAPRD